MKTTDFNKTAYKYELTDGSPVIGETRVNGCRVILIENNGVKYFAKARDCRMKCLDVEDEKQSMDKVIKSGTNKIEQLEQRITQLESLLNKDIRKDKIN